MNNFSDSGQKVIAVKSAKVCFQKCDQHLVWSSASLLRGEKHRRHVLSWGHLEIFHCYFFKTQKICSFWGRLVLLAHPGSNPATLVWFSTLKPTCTKEMEPLIINCMILLRYTGRHTSCSGHEILGFFLKLKKVFWKRSWLINFHRLLELS